ncbi:arsenate reductase/protein-tyrosine-phosphatase family protein [Corynebacterium sp. 335C]
MTAAPTVLVVCTGNICRSPVAELMLRDAAERAGSPLHAVSAGTRGVVGDPVHPEMAALLEADGIEPSGHVSRRLTRADASGADLILAMEQEHVDAVLRMFPGALRRTFTLPHLAALADAGEFRGLGVLRGVDRGAARPDVPGIADPIGGARSDYAEAYAAIRRDLDRVLPALLTEA